MDQPNKLSNTPATDDTQPSPAANASAEQAYPAQQPSDSAQPAPAQQAPYGAAGQVPYGAQPNPAQQTPYGAAGQAPYGAQPNPTQQPYGAQAQPSPTQQTPYGAAGQAPYGAQPNPTQQPYGAAGQVPYGVQPNPAQQPYSPYGTAQQPYPYMAAQPQKKKLSAGKIVAIVVSVLVVLGLLFGVGGFLFARKALSPQTQLAAYAESGDFATLMGVCDLYDTFLMSIGDTAGLQSCFAEVTRDPDLFYNTFPSTSCADIYENAFACYNTFMADYFVLMLQNGDYDNYVRVFTEKMLEYDPVTEYYYMTSSTFVSYIDNDYFVPTDEQAQVIVRGFDALIAASTSYEEMYLNLEEYYDCCMALGLQEQAYAIAEQMHQFESANTGWAAA